MSANGQVCIGVRDSGVGGLTVARRVLEIIPNANLLYFADTANVPYGEKTPAQVRHFALSISNFLIEQGAQIVVFACNTTSALALDAARAKFDVPIVGVIEPGARVAAHISNGKIGVLATQATVESKVYTRVLTGIDAELEVLEVACPAFVPLVESDCADGHEAFEACREALAQTHAFGADTLVLGCTHYPLLLPVLQKLAPEMRFVDPAKAVAREVAILAAKLSGQAPQEPRFWASGAKLGVENWGKRLLGLSYLNVEEGPVFRRK